MLLSIVIPVHDEQDNVAPLHNRLSAAVAPLGAEWEFLFVDDGSGDGTAEEISKLRSADPRVKLVRLTRNFGHQAALTAGLDRASGEAVLSLDGDLQHPPELIPELVARWKEGNEVVCTLRRSSAGASSFKNASGALFYRLFGALSGVDLRANAADFRLLGAPAVRALRGVRERHRFIRGLVPWLGFRTAYVEYDAAPRAAGTSKYGLLRMSALALDAVISFSTAPLYVAIAVGFMVSFFGFAYGGFAVYSRIVTGQVIRGWTSLMIVVSIVGGFQLLLTGLFGLYLGKVYDEVKQRPLYVVAE